MRHMVPLPLATAVTGLFFLPTAVTVLLLPPTPVAVILLPPNAVTGIRTAMTGIFVSKHSPADDATRTVVRSTHFLGSHEPHSPPPTSLLLSLLSSHYLLL